MSQLFLPVGHARAEGGAEEASWGCGFSRSRERERRHASRWRRGCTKQTGIGHNAQCAGAGDDPVPDPRPQPKNRHILILTLLASRVAHVFIGRRVSRVSRRVSRRASHVSRGGGSHVTRYTLLLLVLASEAPNSDHTISDCTSRQLEHHHTYLTRHTSSVATSHSHGKWQVEHTTLLTPLHTAE
jgi:hypothetical protein